mmetsp:Transcript_24742/g.61671  ORF Transcript_24742/g.61671 Transcript_24742/m.61671 type:complete len:386 (+) Transcript_24742:2148-3305(+)
MPVYVTPPEVTSETRTWQPHPRARREFGSTPAGAAPSIRTVRDSSPTSERTSTTTALPPVAAAAGAPKCVCLSGVVKVRWRPDTADSSTTSASSGLCPPAASTTSSPGTQSTSSDITAEEDPAAAVAPSRAQDTRLGTPCSDSLPSTNNTFGPPETRSELLPLSSGTGSIEEEARSPTRRIVARPGNGRVGEPAASSPPKILMAAAASTVDGRLSSKKRLPRMSKSSSTGGSMSSLRFHGNGTLTSPPASGSVPPGHWVALLQSRMKGSFSADTGGGGTGHPIRGHSSGFSRITCTAAGSVSSKPESKTVNERFCTSWYEEPVDAPDPGRLFTDGILKGPPPAHTFQYAQSVTCLNLTYACSPGNKPVASRVTEVKSAIFGNAAS